MGLIFFFSSRPDLPSAPEPFVDFVLKKMAHAFVYAVLAALLVRATSARGRIGIVPWAIAILYAVTDEFHQTFVPGRTGRWTDVAIDAAGAAVGVAFMLWLRRRGRS
jgi:VanZ family protein